jgi:hypothetical protein
MKTLILSSLIVLSAFISNAQSPVILFGDTLVSTIYIGTVPTANLHTYDFRGEIIQTTPAGGTEMVNELFIENQTGDSLFLIVSRRRIGVDTSWVDFLCWGHETAPFGGQCIDAVTMDSALWTGACNSQYIVKLADGEHGEVSSHIFPNLNQSGCGTYRYYVGDCNNPYLDSVDISVCYTLGINELDNSELSISVSPNPANNVFQISTESSEIMNYSVVNAIGQTVNSGVFTKNHTVEASQFEGGLYFVTVTDESGRTKTNRIVVNH